MAKRKKKHQTERVLEPIVKPGQPIKAPAETPITPAWNRRAARLAYRDAVYTAP